MRICACILWKKLSLSHSLCKRTPGWKKYTTTGCGGCDKYELCYLWKHQGLFLSFISYQGPPSDIDISWEMLPFYRFYRNLFPFHCSIMVESLLTELLWHYRGRTDGCTIDFENYSMTANLAEMLSLFTTDGKRMVQIRFAFENLNTERLDHFRLSRK